MGKVDLGDVCANEILTRLGEINRVSGRLSGMRAALTSMKKIDANVKEKIEFELDDMSSDLNYATECIIDRLYDPNEMAEEETTNEHE